MIKLSKCKDLLNITFGYLTVIGRAQNNKHNNAMWLCKCKCGKETVVRGRYLTAQRTVSCGCKKREDVIKRSTTHGLSGSKLFRVWAEMKFRCRCKTNKSYKNYGARGITICNEWLEFKSFYDWSMENGYKEGLTIDRIDNNQGYRPDNCRWTTYLVQSHNLRTNVHITYQGVTKTQSEWCRELRVDRGNLVRHANRNGISRDQALAEIMRKRNTG